MNYYLNHRTQFLDVILKTEFSIQGKKLEFSEWADQTVKTLLDIKKNGKRLYFIGNGASAALSSHFSTDFTKNGNFQAFTFSDADLLTCFSNDYSYEDAYMEMLKRYLQPGDGLVAISSSGKSPNILKAGVYAREVPQTTVFTLSGFKPDNPLRELGNNTVYVPDGSYGLVESAHAYFLHVLIDRVCDLQATQGQVRSEIVWN